MKKIVNGIEIEMTQDEIDNLGQDTAEDLLKNAKSAKKEICKNYLQTTDWHCLRFADDGNSYPQEIRDKRVFARTATNEIEDLTTIEEVEAYDINNIIS